MCTPCLKVMVLFVVLHTPGMYALQRKGVWIAMYVYLRTVRNNNIPTPHGRCTPFLYLHVSHVDEKSINNTVTIHYRLVRTTCYVTYVSYNACWNVYVFTVCDLACITYIAYILRRASAFYTG